MTDRLIDKYDPGLTEASFSALLELVLTLKTYRDSIVLVGGWVPYLLIREHGRGDFHHIGSIDIDLAIDPKQIKSEEYASIVKLIKERGYEQKEDVYGNPIEFSFLKITPPGKDGIEYIIQVDFLTSRGFRGKKHRHRSVQTDLPARITKGCELAFRYHESIKIEGTLPDGAETRTEIKILNIPGCLAMKGIVLGERYKEKDAYDIYSVISQCLDSPEMVASEVTHILGDEIAIEGIDSIKEKFRKQTAEGPTWTAWFMEPDKEEMRTRKQAQVYVEVSKFIRVLESNEKI